NSGPAPAQLERRREAQPQLRFFPERVDSVTSQQRLVRSDSKEVGGVFERHLSNDALGELLLEHQMSGSRQPDDVAGAIAEIGIENQPFASKSRHHRSRPLRGELVWMNRQPGEVAALQNGADRSTARVIDHYPLRRDAGFLQQVEDATRESFLVHDRSVDENGELELARQ